MVYTVTEGTFDNPRMGQNVLFACFTNGHCKHKLNSYMFLIVCGDTQKRHATDIQSILKKKEKKNFVKIEDKKEKRENYMN